MNPDKNYFSHTSELDTFLPLKCPLFHVQVFSKQVSGVRIDLLESQCEVFFLFLKFQIVFSTVRHLDMVQDTLE